VFKVVSITCRPFPADMEKEFNFTSKIYLRMVSRLDVPRVYGQN